MNDMEFTGCLQKYDLKFQHWGILVRDMEKVKEGMSLLPGVGDWFGLAEFHLSKADHFVGNSCKFKVLSTTLYDSIPVEFVEPDLEYSKDTLFEEYFTRNENGGIHHYSYSVPSVEALRVIIKELQDRGYRLLMHAKITEGFQDVPEGFFCEFCYMEPPYGSINLEFNYTGTGL